MRIKTVLLALVLIACGGGTPTSQLVFTSQDAATPPSGDIKIKFWDGSELVDKGGQGRACDRGCISFAQEEIGLRGDAGTPALTHESFSRAMRCVQACGHTAAVSWPTGS